MKAIDKYQLWLDASETDVELRSSLLAIKDDQEAINELFENDLKFGTGGLRAKMGIGSNRLNTYTVRRATQGVANYIIKNEMKKSCAIAYDTRNKSPEFAEQVARVMLGNGFDVFLFDSFTPTPELSFAVRELKCSVGIVITASHNPPVYNGYKVYGPDGCQITLNQANSIIKEIDNVHIFRDIRYYNELLNESEKFNQLSKAMDGTYLESVLSLIKGNKLEANLKVVYSSLHGTGIKLIPDVLEHLNAGNISIVAAQAVPDGNFSTVKSPNPEEHEALELGIQQAKFVEADLVLATDPDCDRLGVAVCDSNANYILLNGNQLGALLLDYLVVDSKNSSLRNAVVKTIVTSEFGALIAEANGCDVFNTLTGFKFIGEKIAEFEQTQSHHFLFGYEESYGYLSGDFVRDKDAVIASTLLVALTSRLKSQGLSLLDRLDQLQRRFGFFSDKLISIELSKELKVEDMLRIIGKFSDIAFLNQHFSNVAAIEDYDRQTRFDLINDTNSNIDLPRENVLKVHFQDKSWFAIRPSGTEPKLKIYFSSVDAQQSVSEAKLETLVKNVQDTIQAQMDKKDA